jgi:hypothetical protein
MFKPSFLNILFFWIIKYIAFYILMMFKNQNYALIQLSDLKNGRDIFYYLWMFLFLPTLFIILFSVPQFLSFRIKNPVYLVILLAVIFVLEYILYTCLASTSDLMNGIYNGIISVIVYLLFFFNRIKLVFLKMEVKSE